MDDLNMLMSFPATAAILGSYSNTTHNAIPEVSLWYTYQRGYLAVAYSKAYLFSAFRSRDE